MLSKMVRAQRGWWTTVVLLLVVAIWWPVVHGSFVWDDIPAFVLNDGLTRGDAWKHLLFRGFEDWNNYFRPLGVALFTLQLRLFDKAPAPMHMASLLLHLLNTWLVGRLAGRACAAVGRDGKSRRIWIVVSMLLFGVHPALIETVSWIGCQFDLLATGFMLAGLWASAAIISRAWRAVAIAVCFFLAACSKEAAVVFPLLLVVWDWALQCREGGAAQRMDMMVFLRRNALFYAVVLLAGFCYLAFRRWGLGVALPPASGTFVLSLLGRVQLSCSVYMHYVRMLFLPTVGMAPLHMFDAAVFERVTFGALLVDMVAISMAASSAWFAWRHASAWACIMLAFTFALLPVLRVLTTYFDENLYHDRYITCALAVMCGMLPLLRLPDVLRGKRGVVLAGALLGLGWVAVSTVSIRSIVPLWGNSESLWSWELLIDPKSDYARNWLLATWEREHRYSKALPMMEQLLAERTQCAVCSLRIASIAMSMDDLPRAEAAMELARNSPKLAGDQQLYGLYLYQTGRLLMAKREYKDAASLLSEAVKTQPEVADYQVWHDKAVAALKDAPAQ